MGEVFLLIVRINEKNLREKGIGHKDKAWADKNGNVHIRREAMNDNWY